MEMLGQMCGAQGKMATKGFEAMASYKLMIKQLVSF